MFFNSGKKVKVKLVIQLLSRSVANSLEFCMKVSKYFETCTATINFINYLMTHSLYSILDTPFQTVQKEQLINKTLVKYYFLYKTFFLLYY